MSLLASALHRRKSLLDSSHTDLIRLIDGTGDNLPGHFLETFGPHWLLSTTSQNIHPDLRQELQNSPHSIYWKQLDPHEKESPTLLHGAPIPEKFTGLENNVKYHLSFHSGYSQGLFLDQRDNRQKLRHLLQPGHTLLNTFAYTGAFSICAALAGATTTTLDLSQPYLDWARDNFTLNQLDPTHHHFCKGDTFHWLKRFAKQGRKFDAIVLDPPTFSRDQKGKIFRVEKDYHHLLALALPCLKNNGTILATTNCKKITLSDFKKQLQPTTPTHFKTTTAPMPLDFTAPPYLKSLWITST